MSDLLDVKALQFFFGPHFNVEVAMHAFSNYEKVASLERELLASLEQGVAHTGIQLVGYHDVDSGLSTAMLMQHPGEMSGVSFFAESRHRLFGGSTLICVPLAFCSSLFSPQGDHLVYRHTYKRASFTSEEIDRLMTSGTDEQKLKAFVFTKCRLGYETIPGMTYVGMTRRSWQKRYLEHVEDALNSSSSRYLHEAIRNMQGQKVICVHDVSGYGMTQDAAKAYESKLIQASSLWPRGLNMKV